LSLQERAVRQKKSNIVANNSGKQRAMRESAEVYWKGGRTPQKASEIFQYFLRTTPENSAPRAKTSKFIGSGGRNFRSGGKYLE
jgi:hypothetical protein